MLDKVEIFSNYIGIKTIAWTVLTIWWQPKNLDASCFSLKESHQF